MWLHFLCPLSDWWNLGYHRDYVTWLLTYYLIPDNSKHGLAINTFYKLLSDTWKSDYLIQYWIIWQIIVLKKKRWEHCQNMYYYLAISQSWTSILFLWLNSAIIKIILKRPHMPQPPGNLGYTCKKCTSIRAVILYKCIKYSDMSSKVV